MRVTGVEVFPIAVPPPHPGGRTARDRPDGFLLRGGAVPRVLTSATRVLHELDSARRELTGEITATRTVRLGAFATAAAGLVPKALAALPPQLKVTLREATTPALTRGLHAGTLDLAVIARTPSFRPPNSSRGQGPGNGSTRDVTARCHVLIAEGGERDHVHGAG